MDVIADHYTSLCIMIHATFECFVSHSPSAGKSVVQCGIPPSPSPAAPSSASSSPGGREGHNCNGDRKYVRSLDRREETGQITGEKTGQVTAGRKQVRLLERESRPGHWREKAGQVT